MATATRASGRMECVTDREYSTGRTTMCMRATGATIEELGQDDKSTGTGTSILVLGSVGFDMEMAYKTGLTVINTRESGSRIEGLVLVPRFGRVNRRIRATGRMI